MNTLLKELGDLIHRHSTVTGREFQSACLQAASAYYSEDDLDQYATAEDLNTALELALKELQGLPPA